MKKKQQHLAWLSLFILLSSCSTVPETPDPPGGPVVLACVIDAATQSLECATPSGPSQMLSLSDAEGLGCISPSDLESMLKACRQRKGLDVSVCTLQGGQGSCLSPQLEKFTLDLNHLDNYVCMSEKDRSRITERCNPAGF